MHAGQRDFDEAAYRSLGGQAAGCGKRVEAVVHQLVRIDVVPEVSICCGLREQVTDHAAELLLCSGDLFASMHERRQFGAVVPAGLVADEGVPLQHRFEPPVSAAGLVSDLGQAFEVSADLALVPSTQDRFNVREVPIEAHRRDVRDAVLDTTAALVAQYGLLSVTMSRIAEDTGIGRLTPIFRPSVLLVA